MNYDKNNQLLSMMKPMGANYSFEYDNNVCDRVIRAISPTGVTNSIEYDSYGNPIRTKIHNKNVSLENIDSTKTYYIRGKGTNKYFFIKADKTVRMKQDECSYDKFYIIRTEDDKIKIKHAVLTDYYIKVAGNSIKLMYGDYDNLLDIYQNSNGSYTIGGIDVFTITDTFNVELERASDDNYQQQFYFESVEDGLYIETSSTYTDDGRFIKTVTDALGNTSTYDINTTNGVINSIIDPNNSTTNYIYDDKFRVTNISKGSHNVSYEYDTNNNLSKIIHGTKNYIFNYDEFNNTSSIKVNNTTLVSNSYEPNNGNLSKVTYGNGHEISYTYDEHDRVNTIIKGNEVYVNHYDNLGRLVGISRDISIYQNSTFTCHKIFLLLF